MQYKLPELVYIVRPLCLRPDPFIRANIFMRYSRALIQYWRLQEAIFLMVEMPGWAYFRREQP